MTANIDLFQINPGLMSDDQDSKPSDTPEVLPAPLPLASPERSSFDEEQFHMAASYLKSQFSIPHHVVPTYEDTASYVTSQDRAQDRYSEILQEYV